MKKTITIVDYGSGNLLSAQQSFIKAASLIGFDAEIQISNNPKNLELSTHVVLPGQGAFKTCMDGIQKIPGMEDCLLYTSPSPRDRTRSRMPSSA